jgi:hypothetical protein
MRKQRLYLADAPKWTPLIVARLAAEQCIRRVVRTTAALGHPAGVKTVTEVLSPLAQQVVAEATAEV